VLRDQGFPGLPALIAIHILQEVFQRSAHGEKIYARIISRNNMSVGDSQTLTAAMAAGATSDPNPKAQKQIGMRINGKR
jgi:hypothetical protein